MSAITDSHRDVGLDGVRRYRTKVRVRIDSHDQKDPIWISDDVVSVHTGKTVKGAGQANLVVLPRLNYLNIIRPNDYINIYFNIGDGEGWTRTFFGFVDRVVEKYTVGPDGSPRTQHNILCTDFYKALEKTNVYFNPHLAGRPDLSGEFFGTPNIGGLALMTSGLRVHGSPADIVVNLMLVLLGFGTQFSLPPGYDPLFKDIFRQRRAQFIQNRLGESAKQAIEEAGGFNQLRAQIRSEEQGTAQDLANSGSSQRERINSLFRERGITNATEQQRILESVNAGDVDRVAALLADSRLRNTLVTTDPGRTTDDESGTLDVLNTTLPKATSSLLDVIDVFSFVERTAIDGFHTGYTVWQQQGSLISFARSMSHEIMNELIFDLRPLVSSQAGQHVRAPYSRQPDEIEGNVDENGGTNGITHVPAMVMREYPFSTIDGIDLRGVNVQLDGQEGEIGVVYFGEIFAAGINEPGRHAVRIPNINLSDRREGKGNILAPKSIDVAVVHEDEFVDTELGRSDHEHYNLLEFYSDALLGQDQRFYMHDLLPILTPVHVMRHGLRVRSLTTRFARFPVWGTDHLIAPPPVEEQEEAEEAAEEEGLQPATELGAPCLASEGARFRNFGGNRWGYRKKPHLGPNGSWVMHQGIDIQGPLGTPIYAIADGEVVGSLPDGVVGGYGNSVVIKHDFDGEIFYSHYAHLNSINVGPGAGVPRDTRSSRRKYLVDGFAGGRSAAFPIRVSKGDVIGTMGATGFDGMGVHLHFEIVKLYTPGRDRITPRIHFSLPSTPGPYQSGHTWSNELSSTSFPLELPASSPRPEPPAGYDNSLDPVEFFSTRGYNLVELINGTEAPTDEEESEPDDFGHGPVADEDGQRPRDEVLEEAGVTPDRAPTQTSTRNNVDNIATRQQLIRWALLHDHWYQHNLEYLSGKITMRGAPEIRVGYRLDVPERNMSFYIEGVNHQWKFPDKMTTVLSVTRGQRNDPLPMYILPPLDPFNATDTQRRTSSGRLSTYFAVPDPVAVRRAMVLRSNKTQTPHNAGLGTDEINTVDSLDRAASYNEAAVLARSVDPTTPSIDGEGDLLRISGDLQFELEMLQLERNFNEFLENELDPLLEDTFGFTDEAAENPVENSTSETDAGTDGRNLTAGLEVDLSARAAFLRFLDDL